MKDNQKLGETYDRNSRDSDVPILQSVDRASIQLSDGADPVVVGTCTIDDQPIDLLCLTKLGKSPA